MDNAVSWLVFGGLILGLAGVAILALPDASSSDGRLNAVGAGMLLLGSISWAARSAPGPHSK